MKLYLHKVFPCQIVNFSMCTAVKKLKELRLGVGMCYPSVKYFSATSFFLSGLLLSVAAILCHRYRNQFKNL